MLSLIVSTFRSLAPMQAAWRGYSVEKSELPQNWTKLILPACMPEGRESKLTKSLAHQVFNLIANTAGDISTVQ